MQLYSSRSICIHSFNWVWTDLLLERDQVWALRWLNLNDICTDSREGGGICLFIAPLHLLSLAIWLIPSHAYSSVSVHVTVYSFYRPAASNICSKGPRNWFRGWNTSISNPAPTQGYISLLEDWHMGPICISDNISPNISLPGTDVLIAPERCNLMMDRNNLIIWTFVFVNPT